MTRRANKTTPTKDKDALQLSAEPGKSDAQKTAEISLDPAAHGMATLRLFNKGSFGEQDTTEVYLALESQAKAVRKGDLTHYRAMLAMQADALNGMFTELSRRAAANMGEYLNATQLYLRLGLKAQAQCRATIEALEQMTSGHVQTVKHVHVNEGGQAVIADEFHHHTRGQENGQSSEQPHATGAEAACPSPTLSGPESFGQSVPLSSCEGQAAVPDARGERKRGA